MRPVLKISTCGLVIASWVAPVQATLPEVAPGHYQAIPERNVFGLRPPPAQQLSANPPALLPKITLTGITTILGNKRALMKVAPAGLKPGETNKELSLILTEGQRGGEVEVLQINESAGSVKVNNSGTVMTLTFEKDGAKLPATSVPGGIPQPPSPLPTAGAPNPYLPAANLRRTATRGFRSPGLPGTATINPGAVAAPIVGVPTPTGLASVPAQNSTLSEQQLTAEEQAIINAFQHQENSNNPSYPPLPQIQSTLPSAQPAPAAPNGTGANVPGTTPVLVPQ